jgi:pimeloyl-ACP methyl ester carboxylesterase
MKLKEALINEGFDVYTMNFSGHGGEPFGAYFGIEQFLNDVKDFLRHYSLHSCDVFGYSMGGYVALYLATLQSSILNKIITLGTKFDWTPESAAKEVSKVDPEKIQEKVPAFARILESRHAPVDWIELLDKTASMMQSLGSKPLLHEDNLKRIESRTLVLLGDKDDMADRAYSNTVATWLPKGQFQLLKNTPHPIEKVDINLLTNTIVSFLKT